MSDTATVLRKAAEYLSTHGLHKGDIGEEGGPRCLVGALLSSTYGPVHEARDILASVVEEQYPDRLARDAFRTHEVQFNDHPDTTLPEVLSVLEKAAVRASEEM